MGVMEHPLEHAMTQQAKVRAAFRARVAGGGQALVPEGALEVEFGDGLAKLRWTDAQGRTGHAEVDPDDYEHYVVAGWILPSLN